MTLPPPPAATPPDGDDRDDATLDRFDLDVAPASPEEAAAQVPYRHMIERLRQLPPMEPDPGWEDRAHARWRAARAADRRRRAYVVGAGVVALAAAAAIVLLARKPGGPAHRGLAFAVLPSDGGPRRGSYAVDDNLRATAPRTQPHTALRVYRDARLVVACPGEEACRLTADGIELDLRLDAPGTYRVVVLTSAAPIPPPGAGGLDGDLLDAQTAGATIERSPPILVQP